MNQLSLTGKRWVLPTNDEPSAPGPLAPWLMTILARRGFSEESHVKSYLTSSLAKLDDPLLIADMEPALDRIERALRHGEKITIYGDYDVDGVCATSVLVEFLRGLGGTVDFYIPDRRAEGYGLNPDAIQEIAQKSQLLITVDCGITAQHELELAKSLGLDTIVVDHHQVPEVLPPTVACLNPQRPDCAFPFKGLCAAGVAFMVVVGLRRHLRERGWFADKPEPDVRTLLDIVAVATVADMVPLEQTNRILVAAGLKEMAKGQRVGLRALIDVAKVDAHRISASDLGFRIGPRINARGRLSHAGAAVELMLTRDPDLATRLSDSLDSANRERREIQDQAVEEAIACVDRQDLSTVASLVLANPQWHPGILGLVAAKLVNRYNRPTIIIGEGGKGSARSISGLDIHAAIDAASIHLERFGGHKAAAGLTIHDESIDSFRVDFEHAVRHAMGEPPFIPTLRPDIEVSADSLSLQMVDQMAELGPFGQKNPEPLFVSRQVAVQNSRIVGATHLKLNLGHQGIDAIAFGLGEHIQALPPNVDIAYRIERNVFRGRENLQLRIEDIRPSEAN
ncbi:MAG: single-stranded-DNA-specific exonuclease RecJ [Myxococcota bacterium]|nr:single-stranded-DNA-specific exonuclease RecJ [Myxococcota bacterium]